MRILIISNYFFPEIGAAPNRIYNLTKGLSNFHKVEIIAPLPNYPHGKIAKAYRRKLFKIEQLNSLKVYRYFIYPSKSKKTILRIFSMLSFAKSLWLSFFHLKNKKGINVVIVQNSPLMVSFSALILFKIILKRKVVLNVSDLWPDSALDLGYLKKGKFYNMLKKMEQFNYKNSDAVMGQSNEILQHVLEFYPQKATFLYRNLHPLLNEINSSKYKSFSIIYAGLLGVAQGVFEILEHINFKKLNIQFHIYGDGAEKDDIVNYIASNNLNNVTYKGLLSKTELTKLLPNYHFALVPLITHIKGAVPSKIFELAGLGIPIIFMGSGEAGDIVENYKLGFTTSPKNYAKLEQLLQNISSIDANDYKQLQDNCKKVSKASFNFEKQLNEFSLFLERYE